MVGCSEVVTERTRSRKEEPAERRTRWARIICLSAVARVTSTKSSSALNLSKTVATLRGWLFHLRQYCRASPILASVVVRSPLLPFLLLLHKCLYSPALLF